jgi:hypothetical protein
MSPRGGITYDELHSDPSWLDVDNDGDLDLFITSIYENERTYLYLNNGDGAFTDITWLAGCRVYNGWGQRRGGLRRRRPPDILVASGSGVHLLRNVSRQTGHAVRLRPVRLATGSYALLPADEPHQQTTPPAGRAVELQSITPGGELKTRIRELQGGKGTTSQHEDVAHFGIGDERPLRARCLLGNVPWRSGRHEERFLHCFVSIISIGKGRDMHKYLTMILLALCGLLGAIEPHFMSDPAISPDGNTVCFCYQSDLWTVPFSGGEAKRITVSDANDRGPMWSPDGRWIAFNSDRGGRGNIWLIPSGAASAATVRGRRLRHRLVPPTARRCSPTFVCRARERILQAGHRRRAPAGNRQVRRQHGSLDREAKAIIFNRRGDPFRERYVGSDNGELWRYDIAKNTFTQLTTPVFTERYPVCSMQRDAVYYVASDGDVFQLFRVVNGDYAHPEQLTRFDVWSPRDLGIARANERVVYEYFDQIGGYDPATVGGRHSRPDQPGLHRPHRGEDTPAQRGEGVCRLAGRPVHRVCRQIRPLCRARQGRRGAADYPRPGRHRRHRGAGRQPHHLLQQICGRRAHALSHRYPSPGQGGGSGLDQGQVYRLVLYTPQNGLAVFFSEGEDRTNVP